MSEQDLPYESYSSLAYALNLVVHIYNAKHAANRSKGTLSKAGNAHPLLESEEFVSKIEYDALNRAASIKAPHNNINAINEILPAYDDGGLLKTVKAKLRGSVDETEFVTSINYNPKGQRERIKYGNGATTKYTYDDKNFRLARLLTTRENGTDTLQDLNYEYDEMGNITNITDDAQQTIFFNGQVVSPSQRFEYDALYRLTKATGREHINNNAGTEPEENGYPHASTPIPSDASALRNYTREWEYDEVGNILELIHTANNGNWNRSYNYSATDNRLLSTEVGNTVNYTYNEYGSMAAMPHLQAMDWDFAERLSHITKGSGNGATEAYYNYDGTGQRTRKVVEKNGIIETRLYLGGFEIFRKKAGNVLELERETLHVMDDTKRIALVETLTVDNSVQIANPIPVQRYQLSNNIESATLELDESASIISYEEYYPYGDTSYQAGRNANEVSQKRYRYTGKEKDEESGLYYMLARYYSGWLGRWTASDPAGLVDGPNLYMYCRGNPVGLVDPKGMSSEEHWVEVNENGEQVLCGRRGWATGSFDGGDGEENSATMDASSDTNEAACFNKEEWTKAEEFVRKESKEGGEVHKVMVKYMGTLLHMIKHHLYMVEQAKGNREKYYELTWISTLPENMYEGFFNGQLHTMGKEFTETYNKEWEKVKNDPNKLFVNIHLHPLKEGERDESEISMFSEKDKINIRKSKNAEKYAIWLGIEIYKEGKSGYRADIHISMPKWEYECKVGFNSIAGDKTHEIPSIPFYSIRISKEDIKSYRNSYKGYQKMKW
jgi:RHS repeat-associated protein